MTSNIWVFLTSHKKVTVPFILLMILLVCLPLALKFTAINWLEKNGAGQVSLKDIDLNLFTGTLAIKGFSIQENENQKIALSELKLNCSMLSLLKKRILVESLTIDGLDLSVEKDRQQLYLGMTIPLATTDNNKTDKDAAREPKTIPAFGIKAFYINNSKISYHQTDLSGHMAINKIVLQNLYSWIADTPATIDIDTHLNESPLSADIQLNAFSKNRNVLADIKLDHLSLTPFSALAASAIDGLHGYLDLEIELSINMAEDGQIKVQQSGNISIVDVAGKIKPNNEKNLTLEDVDAGWKGPT